MSSPKRSTLHPLADLFWRAAQLPSATFEQFLQDILTPQEREELLLRWQIIKRLEQGMAQRDIAKELGVGIATVTRGSRALQESKGGFKALL